LTGTVVGTVVLWVLTLFLFATYQGMSIGTERNSAKTTTTAIEKLLHKLNHEDMYDLTILKVKNHGILPTVNGTKLGSFGSFGFCVSSCSFLCPFFCTSFVLLLYFFCTSFQVPK
jgi:hypothetical protein